MTKTIDDLKPGDRVRFEHEDGSVIVGEVVESYSTNLVRSPALEWGVLAGALTNKGFTLAHVEPATPPLPEEPPVGSVVRWKEASGDIHVAARSRSTERGVDWGSIYGWHTWAVLNGYGTPELLVSRTELVNEIADWVAGAANIARYEFADAIRERFLS